MMFSYLKTNKIKCAGFTLIELLIVTGILAVLGVATVAILNPVEIFNQSRDSSRLVDLYTIDKAFQIASFNSSINFGSVNTIYISLPDDVSPTCNSLSLPTLPSNWSYACVTSANLKNVDGTGWMPVNFTLINTNPPLTVLPTDPVNQAPYSYYSYITDGIKYELTSFMQSKAYKIGGSKDITTNDGGVNSALYEKGSNLTLNPINYIVIKGGFEYTPPFIAAQTASGRWIDGTAAGSATKQPYSIHGWFGNGTGNVRFDSANAHSGKNSLKIHTDVGAFSETKVNTTCYYCASGIKILPNTQYQYSAWMKSENVSGSASGQHIQLLFSNASGTNANVTFSGPGGNGTSSEFNATGSIAINKVWTQYTGTFTTGATAAWFHPEYRVYGHTGAATLTGDFWFDDIAVYQ